MISLSVIILVVLHFNAVVYSQNACYTPNKERAFCLPLNQCPILLKAIYTRDPLTKHFLRQSVCTFGQYPNVCCGSVAGYSRRLFQSPNTIGATPTRSPVRKNNVKPTKVEQDPKNHRNLNLLPPLGQCGQQGLQDKIVGGTEAGIDEFPWLALLKYKKDGEDVGFHCGGMLINERYILTAAHCVTGNITRYYGNVFQVRLGEYDIRTIQDCLIDEGCNEPPVDVMVEEAIFNDGYDDYNRDRYHDIALLRLRNPIKLSYFIQPICLPLNGEETTPGTNMSIAGWGRTEVSPTSDVKRKAQVPYVVRSQCNNVYSSLNIGNNQLCAGGQIGVDSCNGDSGGPIMNLLADHESWYAEGLVSFGPRFCGTENWPGVYTRIYGYLNWILDNMRP